MGSRMYFTNSYDEDAEEGYGVEVDDVDTDVFPMKRKTRWWRITCEGGP